MNRREMLLRSGAAALAFGAFPFPMGWTRPLSDNKKKHILMFTRSQGFEHSVVKRKDGSLSFAESIVTGLSEKHNFQVTCSKDGREFLPESIAKYDGFLFETTGDLTQEGGDHNPPMPPEGKKAFLEAIAEGKGFVGCHCASDTFHSHGKGDENQAPDERDPYIAMLGGEFIVHGSQQKATMRIVDPAFPGLRNRHDFTLLEEWYALKNFAPDLHVILVQSTQGMNTKGGGNTAYNRADFPETWARHHHKGRVFYTSMGHREDMWQNQIFQELLLGGLAWSLRNIEANIAPNLEQVAPHASILKKA